MTDLFREEAITHQGQKLEGEVTIATHMSFNIIIVLVLLILVVGLTYLFLGEYHRKEVVSGYLRPTTGLSKVYPVAAGRVDQLYVKEGQSVKKGELLARIRMDKHLSSGAEVSESIIQELIRQKNILSSSLATQKQLMLVNKEKSASQIVSTKAQLLQAKNQQALLQERLTLSQQKLNDAQALINSGFISQREYQEQQDRHLTMQQQVEDIQAQVLKQEEQLTQLAFQTQQLPLQYAEQQGQLNSQLADISQKIAQADAQRSLDVRSNRAGKITNMLLKPGMMTQVNRPLMTILPEGATLEAVLFVPTRAYGFVKAGQKTRIRYQAFPYQRFGIYSGEIIEVSQSVVLPNETTLPVTFQEPVYQVVVKLNAQGAEAYGATVPLQSGMLLEADIMVDRRTLFEWLFEPIYSIKGAV
jgi:membrane fusion protein